MKKKVFISMLAALPLLSSAQKVWDYEIGRASCRERV